MNNDKIKGTIDDATGRAKRQVGEWTGDTQTQVDGAAQQVKGKAEKAVGNIRDAVNNATNRPVDRGSNMDDKSDRESVPERE